MSVDVSVIIPFFGQVHRDRLSIVIDSIKRQRDVSLEIIVSEQVGCECTPLFCECEQTVHVVSRPDVIGGQEVYNAGKARNLGLAHARGRSVYFNDADVIFLNAHFLRSLMTEMRRGEVFIRPGMWRLMQREVPRLLELKRELGIEAAISKLQFKTNYLATLTDDALPLELVEFDGRIFSATTHELLQYRDDDSLRGKENQLWQRIVHCGAIFASRDDIEAVGGYSTEYPVCVYEDSDLQWKLRERFLVREIHQDARFDVLHLDHELPYRSVPQEQNNRNIFEQRKLSGISEVLKVDLRDWVNFSKSVGRGDGYSE